MLIPSSTISYQSVSPETVTHETPKTIPEMIDEIAPKFEQSPKLIKKITWCESNYQVKVHDNGHGKGVTGIHKKTFQLWLPKYEKEQGETLNYDSSYDQLKMMSWAFSKGDSYRNQWTSYVAYMNGGTYSFYSKLLGKNFTVKCK
jgi:hypothetical protein